MSHAATCAVVGLLSLVVACPLTFGQEEKKAAQAVPAVYRFEVPLPIAGKTLTRRISQALKKLPVGGARPIFVLEFRPAESTGGEGSSFGDALDLARFLSSDALSGVRTVAWVSRTVKGHAVLPILACEQIVMARGAEFGAAGINERTIDETLRRAYTEIAERRRTVPAAIALGLLDRNLAVAKIAIEKQVRYETPAVVTKLREQFGAVDEEVFFRPGEEHLLSALAIRHAPGFSILLADDRRALASVLQVPLQALQQDLAPDEGWKPIRIDLHGPIHRQLVNFVLRSVEDHRQRGDCNLIVLNIDSGGGDLVQSLRLANYLAELGGGLRSVAFVEKQARGDAALIALACDELIMHPEAVLGGPGEAVIDSTQIEGLRQALPPIFNPRGRDWSLALALVDPQVEVHPYQHPVSGDTRYLSADEEATLENLGDWQREDRTLETNRGITGHLAGELGLARDSAHNLADVKALYRLEGDLEQVRPNWALALVEWLADPRIAGVLLFVGWFALMFEMSTPGVAAPGFVAALCFLLYFWSQFLHGTAGWLEVLLFVGGLACLSVELFVLPGFGVFGIGGALMIISSIVLASQTFVLPANSYQLRQFPVSLLMVAAAMTGGMASIYVIRRFLPDTPYFNNMLLSPPRAEEREELRRREAMVTWDHLLNQRGVTTTPLVPAGKVQFGQELIDCVSRGELVAKGMPVVVEEVHGNRVVVRKVSG